MQGMVWARPDEYVNLCCMWQDKPSMCVYVCMCVCGGVLQGVVGKTPVCILEGAYEGWTGEPQVVLRRLSHGAASKLDKQGA